MKKSKYTEEQIIGTLKQMEAGWAVKNLARELGVSEATIYTWKSKYGGLEVSEARRLRDERLNAHWFRTLDDARQKTERWRMEYNNDRPHSSLGYRTPEQFAALRVNGVLG